MEKTKKNESANVVANQATAKAVVPIAKVAKEQPKEQAQTAEQLQDEIVKKQKELQMKLLQI